MEAKGHGRARQGSIRAAQWRGGGIIFGPTPRSYEQKLPRKMRRAAVCSALSVKAAEDRLVVLDQLALTQPKTREMAAVMSRLAVNSSALILMAGADEMVERASNNLPEIKLLRAEYVNVRDLLNYDFLVIPQSALSVIETILG